MTSTEQKLGLSDDAAGLPHREEEQMGAGTAVTGLAWQRAPPQRHRQTGERLGLS